MPLSQASLQGTPTPGDSLRRRKAEDARLELIADIWEQVRTEVLQERLQQLSQKVVLQRELISARDQRAQLIRRQEEEVRVKKRNDKKKRKQETQAALQDKCRQSLALDRKTKSQSLNSKTSAQSAKKQTGLKDHDTHKKSISSSRSVHSSNSGNLRPLTPVSSSTQGVENEDNDTSKNEQAVDSNGKEMPATIHNAELFKLYGHNAGKYSNASKLFRKKVPHANLKTLTGNLSASQIWTTLWSDSVSKLLQADERFPKDLKETFSSHVRQGITKFKKPVSRSFTQTQDVPDLESLMDQSKLHHLRVLRHKTQLMYRSSLVNQDRTRIVLFNNPLPSLGEGDEGVARFLPPCQDTDSVCTEASYLRWIKDGQCVGSGGNGETSPHVGSGGNGETAPHVEKRMQPSLLSGGTGSGQDLQDIWDCVVMRRKPKKEPRYHFLTEKEAQTPGAFLARLRLSKSTGHLDFVSPQGISHSRGEPASHLSPAERSRLESSWEPLSMHALSEYKDQLSAGGCGEFQQGRPAMWSKLPS